MKRFTFLFLASWLYGDMNFEDLISKAINHHPSIQMSQDAFKMSEEELNSAKWQYFPTPSVDFSNSTKNDQVVAKLEQPIWTGGKLDDGHGGALGKTLKREKARSGWNGVARIVDRRPRGVTWTVISVILPASDAQKSVDTKQLTFRNSRR